MAAQFSRLGKQMKIQEARGDLAKVDWKQQWIIQPKIDGVRGFITWCTETWQYQVYSKAGNRLPRCHFSGLIKELFDAGLLSRTRSVDGEIFCGDWGKTNGLIHSTEKRPDLQMHFYIFDIIDKNTRASLATRQKLIPRQDGRWFKVVKSYPVKDKRNAKKFMNAFISQGHEGAVMKDVAGKYGSHQTWIKLKPRETVDVPITGINVNDNGNVISISVLYGGKDYKVKCDQFNADDIARLVDGRYTVAEVEHTKGDFKHPSLKRLRSDKKIMGVF